MKGCPSALELSRALSGAASDGGELEQHLATCASCSSEAASVRRLVGLARQLPAARPTRARAEELRTALVASTPAAAARPRGWLGGRARGVALGLGAVVVAAAAVGLLWFRDERAGEGEGVVAGGSVTVPAPVKAHGAVYAHDGARYVEVGGVPDEIVRLSQGHLTVEVSPLAAGERYRVITSDAEIEVRGTAFDVEAEAGRLVAVRVLHGRVEVRVIGAGVVVLGAGETWMRSEASEKVLPSPSPSEKGDVVDAPPPVVVRPSTSASTRPSTSTSTRPSTSTSTRPSTSTSTSTGPSTSTAAVPSASPSIEPAPSPVLTPAEAAFEAGWRALREGDHDAAAEAFTRAGANVREPVAADARFWAGVALARAGHRERATLALRGFVTRFPASPRLGEASAMLGWLLLESGDLDEAELRFHAATDDAASAVRDSAHKGLATISTRRAAAPPR